MALALLAWMVSATPLLAVGGIFAQCKIVDRIEDRSIVILDVGRNQGIALRDPAVLLSDTGQLSATGRVFYLEPSLCAIRLGWRDRAVTGANTAVVVSRTLPNVCRIALPAGTTITASVTSVAPGHRTLWLDQGRDAGLHLGDVLLVSRATGVIARAEILELYEQEALARLVRLTPNTSVAVGDVARLWPSPDERRSGRVEAPVSFVEATGDQQAVWLPAGPSEGLAMDSRVELHRAGAYVATAVVDLPGIPLTRARTVEAYARQPAQVGDRAVLVASGQAGAVGRVFKIDRDYCLISAGEDVGIRRGQRLFVVRDGQHIASLVVKTVKETYSGADLLLTGKTGGQTPRQWDQVVADLPQSLAVRRVGRVVHSSPNGLFVAVGEVGNVGVPEPGTLVSVASQSEAPAIAAVVIHKTGSGLTLHVPRCWGRPTQRLGAEVRYTQVQTKSGENVQP
ncbi:MAG: hypothetical protein JXQ73_16485 [Phycisphaerae bacterium]|nr:hypothetical protein [Phycisphaerae bacterium]